MSMQYFLSLENYTLYHPLSLLLHLGYLNVLSMALDAIIEAPLQEFLIQYFVCCVQLNFAIIVCLQRHLSLGICTISANL